MKRTEINAVGDGPAGNLGLGLYIAERVVNAHKGRIDVESSEEAGTTFTVHLARRG
jgi:signal transduction histidine kinase